MKIITAEHSGYCYGVKRAVGILESLIPSESAIGTLGPIIHNTQVTDYYETQGVKIIESISDVPDDGQEMTLIIRSHGAPKSVYEEAAHKNIKIHDATCPYVKKIQNTVSTYATKGYNVIIVGNPAHPEVIGINGWCDDHAQVIENASQLNQITEFDKPTCVVAQTTYSIKQWELITQEIKVLIPDVIIFNTICLATEQRQKAVLELANQVDLMIVVGGKHSSNTIKLAELCSKMVRTIHIETKDDLNGADLIGTEVVGITAGASTPDWIVQSVILKIENEGEVIF